MKTRIACGVAAVALLTAAPVAAQSSSSESLALGRKYSSWFFDGHADSLWVAMDSAMQGRVGGIESIEDMMDRVLEQIGEETEVVAENVYPQDDGVLEYRRLSEFDAAPERVVLMWRIAENGMLTGARIQPESQAPPVPEE